MITAGQDFQSLLFLARPTWESALRGPSPGIGADFGKRIGLIPHDQPVGHLVVVLPAFCPQIASIGPFLPVNKYCAVYHLRFDIFHCMEEVIGKIDLHADGIFRVI
jgi:hypothetical protein